MTSIKDKLASSVRQAKSATPSKSAAPRVAAGGAKQTKTQAELARPATIPARNQGTAANLEPVSSTHVLFPDRVWPD